VLLALSSPRQTSITSTQPFRVSGGEVCLQGLPIYPVISYLFPDAESYLSLPWRPHTKFFLMGSHQQRDELPYSDTWLHRIAPPSCFSRSFPQVLTQLLHFPSRGVTPDLSHKSISRPATRPPYLLESNTQVPLPIHQLFTTLEKPPPPAPISTPHHRWFQTTKTFPPLPPITRTQDDHLDCSLPRRNSRYQFEARQI
jgi:hypothetical protein